jgi:hypothetical protein
MDLHFVNNDTGWVCSNDLTSGGLWRTTDGGISWQTQMNYTQQPSKIFFVNPNTGWVIGNAGTNLFKTTNCGMNWNLIASTSSDFYRDIFFATPDTGWRVQNVGIGNKSLVRSTNGGNTWDSVNAPKFSTSSRLFFINNTTGWIGSAFYKIYATKDGFNWGNQPSPIIRSYNVSFIDTLNGWAGYSGLVHTTDGGGPIVSVGNETTVIPKDFILEQNYPNPFNQSSIISYQITIKSRIEISIYDIRGRKINTIVNETKQPGKYETRFNSEGLSSGVYIYTMYADGKRIDAKRMILTK